MDMVMWDTISCSTQVQDPMEQCSQKTSPSLPMAYAIAEMEREYSPNHPIPTLLLSVIPNTSPPPPPAISVFPRVTPRILFNQQEKCLEKPTPAPTPSSCEESPEVKKTSPPSPPSNSPFAYGRFIATATTTSTATTTAAPAVPTSASSLGGPLYETRKITFPGTEMSQENMEHYAEFMNAIQSLKITSEAEASALIAEAVGVFDTLEYDYLLQDYILEFVTELEHHHQIQKEVILDCKKVLDSLTTLHFERGSACAFTDSNRRSVLLLFNPPELKAPLQIYFCVEQAIMPWSVESLRSVVLKLVDSQGVSHFILGENADLPMMNQARPSGKVRASDTELLEVQQLFLRTYGLSEAFISHLFDLLWATVGGLHTLSETFKGFTEKARIGKEAASLFTESSSMLHNIPPQPFSPSMVEHILNQPPSKVAQKQRITRKPTELRQVTEVEEIASTSKDRPAATDISSQIPNFEFSAQVQPPICVPDTGNTLTPPPPLLVPMPPPSLLIPTTDVPTTTNGATEHPTTPQVTPGDSQPQSQQPPQPTTPITNNTQYSSQPPPLSPSTPAASIIGSLNEHTGPPLQLLPLFDQQFTDFSMVDDPVIQTEDLMLPGWWPPDV
ncbi:hypothetical protein Pelo_4050 [Pelomyxa schiedti]|nr:hypothetical protein Pelo_4050 [Pelomyxa schiedti]